ncbi:MAG: VCBS repeat-containing protein [Flavobacteriales bacterium]|nr:VCBS repeat-containing protein [Flavobacteriales bacterium]MCX7768747.1 VCBS repeat-containing protein [Flavobacteriales bacterium]MDW8409906.1 FG-GAP and VCBS repeat-containing protein [Flavobacteriales bacterium]
MQIHRMDLNNDGRKDLITFDRSGNRILPFLNLGGPGQLIYQPAPEYREVFPDSLHAWIFLEDYNGDGKEDLFSYHLGGASVYKNVASSQQGSPFQLVKKLLLSDYGLFTTNIYISGSDYPAIADLDKDGDLDIITFNVLGACLEMHRNLSKELYGHCDSLVFKLHTDNWGHVVEDPNTNVFYLNDSCDGQFYTTPYDPARHAGGSLLSLDVNGDGRKDLVVGDLSFLTLTLLVNTGPPGTAVIGNVNTTFPAGLGTNVPVQLEVFPAAFYIDVNNDDRRDLLVSPNFSVQAQNARSLWLYLNNGSDSLPQFSFQFTDFLQRDMVDMGEGAYPVLHDLDNDGLLDLVVGNGNLFQPGNVRSTLYYFKNTGTPTHPQFELLSHDLAGLSVHNYLNITPTFGDLDGDNDPDLLFGESSGRLHWYEYVGVQSGIPQFQLKQNGVGFIQEPQFSAPQLFDLDADGLLDIVCGHRLGTLNYYRNIGTTQNPVFTSTPTITNLGGVNVIDSSLSFNSYSVPWFFRDENDSLRLYVGSHNGRIYHYTNISGNLHGSFTLLTKKLGGLREGARTAATTGDLNGDGYLDLIVGNYSGGLTLFLGNPNAGTKAHHEKHFFVKPHPNPALDNIYWDERIHDIELIDLSGRTVRRAGKSPLWMGDLAPGMYVIRGRSRNHYHQELICKR